MKVTTDEVFKCHLFVCTNRRNEGEDCASKGAEKLRDQIKKMAKTEFGNKVRINASGCLGQCEKGVAAVLYPSQTWFFQVDTGDESAILDTIRQCLK